MSASRKRPAATFHSLFAVAAVLSVLLLACRDGDQTEACVPQPPAPTNDPEVRAFVGRVAEAASPYAAEVNGKQLESIVKLAPGLPEESLSLWYADFANDEVPLTAIQLFPDEEPHVLQDTSGRPVAQHSLRLETLAVGPDEALSLAESEVPQARLLGIALSMRECRPRWTVGGFSGVETEPAPAEDMEPVPTEVRVVIDGWTGEIIETDGS